MASRPRITTPSVTVEDNFVPVEYRRSAIGTELEPSDEQGMNLPMPPQIPANLELGKPPVQDAYGILPKRAVELPMPPSIPANLPLDRPPIDAYGIRPQIADAGLPLPPRFPANLPLDQPPVGSPAERPQAPTQARAIDLPLPPEIPANLPLDAPPSDSYGIRPRKPTAASPTETVNAGNRKQVQGGVRPTPSRPVTTTQGRARTLLREGLGLKTDQTYNAAREGILSVLADPNHRYYTSEIAAWRNDPQKLRDYFGIDPSVLYSPAMARALLRAHHIDRGLD